MDGVYNHMMYTLPFPLGNNKYNINHLEMINIMVALKIWGNMWSDKKCDNLLVVEVLKTGGARDSTLATCAHNTWLLSSIYNIQLHVTHIQGSRNNTTELLSRLQGTTSHIEKINILLPYYVWLNTQKNHILFNNDI